MIDGESIWLGIENQLCNCLSDDDGQQDEGKPTCGYFPQFRAIENVKTTATAGSWTCTEQVTEKCTGITK